MQNQRLTAQFGAESDWKAIADHHSVRDEPLSVSMITPWNIYSIIENLFLLVHFRHLDVVIQTLPYGEKPVPGHLNPGTY